MLSKAGLVVKYMIPSDLYFRVAKSTCFTATKIRNSHVKNEWGLRKHYIILQKQPEIAKFSTKCLNFRQKTIEIKKSTCAISQLVYVSNFRAMRWEKLKGEPINTARSAALRHFVGTRISSTHRFPLNKQPFYFFIQKLN